MLKGKTELILTDVHTGKQKKVLEHNMVTNALNDIFRQEGYTKDPDIMYNSIGQPLCTSLLGGILLFDQALEEDAKKYFAPAGTHLTACGAYGEKNTVSSLLRGDYNSEESEIDLDAKTVKYVYDFPTSKGNGTIASVCLTSKNGGYDSYGAPDNNPTTASGQYANGMFLTVGGNRFVSAGNEIPVCIDPANDVVYDVLLNTNPEDTRFYNGVTIRKRRAGLKYVTILRSMYDAREIIEEITLPIDKIWAYCSVNFDLETNAIYIVGANSQTIKSNDEFYVYQIPIGTLKASKSIVTNTSGNDLFVDRAYVYNGYVYIHSSAVYSGPFQFSKINIASSGDIANIPYSAYRADYFSPNNIFSREGNLYFPYKCSSTNGYDNYAVLDTTSNTVYYTNCRADVYKYTGSYRIVPLIGNDVVYYRYARVNSAEVGDFRIRSNYLATINNLSTPITKTAAQTMKVIYTIAEGEPDENTV